MKTTMIAVFAPFRVRFHLYAALLETASTDQILFATDKMLFVPPSSTFKIVDNFLADPRTRSSAIDRCPYRIPR